MTQDPFILLSLIGVLFSVVTAQAFCIHYILVLYHHMFFLSSVTIVWSIVISNIHATNIITLLPILPPLSLLTCYQ